MQPFQRVTILFFFCLAWLAASPVFAAKRPPPNVIVILGDDLGYADVGYRDSDINTPNIDALAKGGVQLGSSHGMSVCMSARAAMMTGR